MEVKPGLPNRENIKAGYKQTEIGVIPVDWKIDKIKNISSITTGSKNTQDKIEDGFYPFFVRSQTVERINSYSFDGEAVLTAGDGVGTGKVFHYINGKYDSHQRVYNITNFSKNINGYFFFLYFSNNFYDRIMSMTAKSSVDSVRMEMIADMIIPIPSLIEQSAIAQALSDTDELITSLEKVIAKKRAIKQGIMQQLLTGKKRLPGFSGEWNTKKLGDCLLEKPDYGINAAAVDYSDNLPVYIRITDITDDGKFSPDKIVSVDNLNSLKYILEKDDLVFARTGASTGKTYLYNSQDGLLVFAGFLIRVKVDPKKLNPVFLKSYTSTARYWHWVSIMSMRSGQPGINGNEFSHLPIILPPTIEEQTAIAQILSDMDSEIDSLEKKLAKYKSIKQGMMQQLLTGKIRLIN